MCFTPHKYNSSFTHTLHVHVFTHKHDHTRVCTRAFAYKCTNVRDQFMRIRAFACAM